MIEWSKIEKDALIRKDSNLKAKIIDFGGWAMPVQYTNVIDEHRTTRSAAGLFDICRKMGEIEVKGSQALDLLATGFDQEIWLTRPSGRSNYPLCSMKMAV